MPAKGAEGGEAPRGDGSVPGFALSGEEELRRRLFWLSAARILVIVLLLAGGSFLLLQQGQKGAEKAVYSLSFLVVLASLLQIAIALLLRAGWRLRPLAFMQVLGDLGFAIALLELTGVSDSLFSFVLPLVVVAGGALLGARGSWIFAGATFLSYGALLVSSTGGTAAPVLGKKALLESLFVHGSAIFLTAALMSYILGLARRAGERAEAAESSLLQLHVLHDSIVRSIGSGILTTDAGGAINFANRAGEEILESRLADLEGRPLEAIFPSMGAGMERAGDARRETEWRTPSGKKRLLGFSSTPLLNPGGEAMGTAVVFQDLTELRELQARASRSERLAMIGELAAGLAHELRNPLASMSGAIELLVREAENREAALFRIVLRETERLNRLVSDFLAYATPAPPAQEAVPLDALVASTLDAFRFDPAAKHLRIEVSPEPAVAMADEDQLRQILLNLVLNAAQASESGGVIQVRCGTSREGQAFLSVEDHGCGIPWEISEKIFDPFFTTKEKGTGLGLPMVHRVVEGLGGDLRVESRPGEGTRFSIYLRSAVPMAEAARRA